MITTTKPVSTAFLEDMLFYKDVKLTEMQLGELEKLIKLNIRSIVNYYRDILKTYNSGLFYELCFYDASGDVYW